jgi:peptidoglycan L-alanyl-D-glutamate endopeptidase CwlK
MSRRLDDLHPTMRVKAFELLARCAEAGIMVVIVDTLRTADEQRENVRKGVSWTQNSRHLTGHAIDLAPYATYNLYGGDKVCWDGADPVWERIGLLGEAIGLRWGGRWKVRDLGHFELP